MKNIPARSHVLAICAAAALFSAAAPGVPASAGEPAALIPRPAKVAWQTGAFELTSQTKILHAGGGAAAEAEMLAALLRPATGLALPVGIDAPGEAPASIRLKLDPAARATLGDEGYALAVKPEGVNILAASPAGLFYAGQTLRQLLPDAVYAATAQPGVRWQAPACAVQDKPRFAWRGQHLDYSRHFFDIEYTKHLLDAMAALKLNVFHMHLTDDDGWRVEIKQYPKLTEIGAWRGTECPLFNTRPGETFSRYGGFFTQGQIREIVAYAAARHIQVMPEVDFPGHSLALVTAYPETRPSVLGKGTSTQGATPNVISPAKEANYAMIDAIVGELAALFPFPYFHIGGDEVTYSFWSQCPEIQALIAREKLDGLPGVQHYFTARMETILAKHGKRMLGWDEILDGKLAPSSTIMSWRNANAGHVAARRGLASVMAPCQHFYYDMPRPRAHDEPPSLTWAGEIDSAKSYAFDPLGDTTPTEAEASRILGVQGCLWSEVIVPWRAANGWLNLRSAGEHADYKLFPRALALAEVGWTPQALRSPGDFDARKRRSLRRLQLAGIALRVPTPDAVERDGLIHLQPPAPEAEVRYTLDGSDPFDSKTAARWDGQPFKARRADLRSRSFLGGQASPLRIGAFFESDARANTAIDHHGNHVPMNLVDEDPTTFFWSSRPVRSGESITIAFDAPRKAASVAVATGKLDNPAGDRLASGVLEASTDGATFTKIADFADGRARGAIQGGIVKAIRITASADAERQWLIVQDPVFE